MTRRQSVMDFPSNDVLLSGPDLMNNLYGVLLRFRRESIAIMADIEQMFYCFLVGDKITGDI